MIGQVAKYIIGFAVLTGFPLGAFAAKAIIAGRHFVTANRHILLLYLGYAVVILLVYLIIDSHGIGTIEGILIAVPGIGVASWFWEWEGAPSDPCPDNTNDLPYRSWALVPSIGWMIGGTIAWLLEHSSYAKTYLGTSHLTYAIDAAGMLLFAAIGYVVGRELIARRRS